MSRMTVSELKLRVCNAKVNAFLILEPLVDMNENRQAHDVKVRAAAAILAMDMESFLAEALHEGGIDPD